MKEIHSILQDIQMWTPVGGHSKGKQKETPKQEAAVNELKGFLPE